MSLAMMLYVRRGSKLGDKRAVTKPIAQDDEAESPVTPAAKASRSAYLESREGQPERVVPLGKHQEDWQRRSEIDNVFEIGGSPILTRQRSAMRQADGTFAVDESVPPEVKTVLSELKEEQREERRSITRNEDSWTAERLVPRDTWDRLLVDPPVRPPVKRISRQRRHVELGVDKDDWQRRSDIDNVFDPGAPILTRQSSAHTNDDGTYDIDESIPLEVRQILAHMSTEGRRKVQLNLD